MAGGAEEGLEAGERAALARLSWSVTQCFGEKEASEDYLDADVLSAVQFDATGRFLATGDKGGRIVIFEQVAVRVGRGGGGVGGVEGAGKGQDWRGMGFGWGLGGEKFEVSRGLQDESGLEADVGARERAEGGGGGGGGGGGKGGVVSYRFYAEFQSHEAEFDYLKSLDIEERINEIAWLPGSGGNVFLLSTNDKTVKLWKVGEKVTRRPLRKAAETGRYGVAVPLERLEVPPLGEAMREVTATPKRVFANGHTYHVNSLSANADGETFLSADDLRVNLWHVEHAKTSFNVVDIKPENMEDLTEVITCARFHPSSAHSLVFSTSRGAIRLIDMRESALCDGRGVVLRSPEAAAEERSYFSEIIASVSDVRFAAEAEHTLLSRDYLTVKVWDTRSPGRPVHTLPVHEQLRPRLTEVYENDAIFDKFEVVCSPDGKRIVTGSYSDTLKAFDLHARTDATLRVSREAVRPLATRSLVDTTDKAAMEAAAVDALALPPPDTARKVLHYAYHPRNHTLSVAGLTNLFVFNGERL